MGEPAQQNPMQPVSAELQLPSAEYVYHAPQRFFLHASGLDSVWELLSTRRPVRSVGDSLVYDGRPSGPGACRLVTKGAIPRIKQLSEAAEHRSSLHIVLACV
jgi:hypothetical protein